YHFLHYLIRCRLRTLDFTRPLCAARLIAGQRKLRQCGVCDRGAVRRRRSGVVGLSSRSAGACVARLLAMAIILVVTRRRSGGTDLAASGNLRLWLGLLRHNSRSDWPMRYTGGRACGSDDLLHRHDLCVAETNPSMAQPLGRAELFGTGADERMSNS